MASSSRVTNWTRLLADCEHVARWAADQQVAPGRVEELGLPPEWADVSAGGRVHAARTHDGRLCLLLKQRVGWKENFEGMFYCEQPLRPDEMIADSAGLSYISLPGLGVFEELYIRESNGPQLFDVYFDLN